LEYFTKILEEREYKPALNNMGNIHFIRTEFETAQEYYQRVLSIDTRNKTALLGVARCNHELENYGLVSKTYRELKTLDPGLAERFAYLDLRGEEATRAADVSGIRKVIVWAEEE